MDKDAIIVLQSLESNALFQVSVNSISMMDSCVKNLKTGNVSKEIDLTEFEE